MYTDAKFSLPARRQQPDWIPFVNDPCIYLTQWPTPKRQVSAAFCQPYDTVDDARTRMNDRCSLGMGRSTAVESPSRPWRVQLRHLGCPQSVRILFVVCLLLIRVHPDQM